jgi:hypothetical protein
MTNIIIDRIRSELRNAFSHCGETDPIVLDEKVENALDTLMCFMASSDPEVVHTDKGDLTGYVTDLAVTSGGTENTTVALQMIVTKDAIHYLMNSYESNKLDDWNEGDPIPVENEINRLVELDEIDVAIFNNV